MVGKKTFFFFIWLIQKNLFLVHTFLNRIIMKKYIFFLGQGTLNATFTFNRQNLNVTI